MAAGSWPALEGREGRQGGAWEGCFRPPVIPSGWHLPPGADDSTHCCTPALYPDTGFVVQSGGLPDEKHQ